MTRDSILDRLGATTFDLLVIGAGIVGARIAYEAACSGMKVALVDAGDVGGSTSSATSKLLHGGLRYLSTGDLRLVRELHRERRVLATKVAPHLVEPLSLVLAVERRSRTGAAKLNVGLALYAALAGLEAPRPRRLSVEMAGQLVGPMQRDAVSACGVVTETVTHDARLTLATVRAAIRAGATAATYVRVASLEHGSAAVEDALGGERIDVRFRAVVNAAGPWVDAVRALEDSRAAPLMRLSKGVHALLPLQGNWHGGLALFDEDGTALAIPWQGMLLLGATDTAHDGDPTRLDVLPGDVDQVLGRFAAVLPPELLDPRRVAHAFAGLRVLPLGNAATARARRRPVIAVGPRGMVSIAGGKMTTHRLIATEALRSLPPALRPRRTSPLALPLGEPCGDAARARLHAQVDPDVAAHLCRLYGADAPRVAACGELERVDPRGPDVWAQVDYALEEELALTVDDVVSRRTTLAVRGLASQPVVEAVAARVGAIVPA